MSIVACRILPDGFEMSADSIVVSGDLQRKDMVKLFEVNDIVVGSSGYARDSAFMNLFLKSHCPATADENGILDFMSEFADWKNKKTGNADITETDFLIGIDKKVFYLNCGWGISQVKEYYAIGAGRDYAMAALYFGAPTEKAAEVATELSIYCEKPIITIRKQ